MRVLQRKCWPVIPSLRITTTLSCNERNIKGRDCRPNRNKTRIELKPLVVYVTFKSKTPFIIICVYSEWWRVKTLVVCSLLCCVFCFSVKGRVFDVWFVRETTNYYFPRPFRKPRTRTENCHWNGPHKFYNRRTHCVN